ncbi:bicarbonate-binding protein, partial [Mesorhizobium sp. M7A.F.Ca.CA.004.05.1.1]
MTKRIRTGTTLKDMTRRDLLVSSAMTAGLFVAARKLFPSGDYAATA